MTTISKIINEEGKNYINNDKDYIRSTNDISVIEDLMPQTKEIIQYIDYINN